jgi:hypothetical protein
MGIRVKNPVLMAGKILAFEVLGEIPELAFDKDEPLDLDIKRPRKKRSLDANAYCWKLIGKLAEATRLSPEEVYRSHIRDVGGNYEVVPLRKEAVETWTKNWGHNGLGWVCDILGDCRKTPGYVNVVTYYGSSVYDPAQMSRLIDHIIQDCKGLGIETLPPAEVERLKEDWRAK